MDRRQSEALRRCQEALPGWRGLSAEDFVFAAPKGFSSFTMGIRCQVPGVEPDAILYRHLEGKDNAILDFEAEQRVYLLLAEAGIAASCLAYDRIHRLEAFYRGRTLTREDLKDTHTLKQIAVQLARFHRLTPALPPEPFFDRLWSRWGQTAKRVLGQERDRFPEEERWMCEALSPITSTQTLEKVRRCVPGSGYVFCHNDTYHGNIFLLDSGEVRLLDFEFSCFNHRAFDFANLFAETKMRHGLAQAPHFAMAPPEYTQDDLGALVEAYLSEGAPGAGGLSELVEQTESMILLSDFMYAMAALPLALEPIQKIRFLPYALERFRCFEEAWEARFGG